ncbi:MAG: tail fiber domain-containing protein, partial [Bacteroidota bacterium]
RKALVSNTSGTNNSATGESALRANTTGSLNTANGQTALFLNTTGSLNTANGQAALFLNTTGSYNTANGVQALRSNTTGYSNVAIGKDALYQNSTRSNLVAVGDSALFNNGVGATFAFHGAGNTALGSKSLFTNTIGNNNTASGYRALFSNTTGFANTAHGTFSLQNNTTGNANTALGTNTLPVNTTGSSNTAAGNLALFTNTTGNANSGFGIEALKFNTTGSNNTAAGVDALVSNTTGSNNTALGYDADVTANNLTNATAIGYNAKVSASNSLVLGGTGADAVNVGIGTTTPTSAKLVISTSAGFNGIDLSTADAYAEMRVIRNTLNAGDKDLYLGFGSPSGSATYIYSDGVETIVAKDQRAGVGRFPLTNNLEVEGDASKSSAGDWLANSDARLKKNIQPLNSQEMLQKLLSLQGITYEWNDDQTGSKRPEGIQYGFTAQNIQTVFPTLVEKDKLGYLQTAYGTYDAMTVEAIRALNEEIGNLKMENAAQAAEIERLKKVETQLDKITAALTGAGIAVEK